MAVQTDCKSVSESLHIACSAVQTAAVQTSDLLSLQKNSTTYCNKSPKFHDCCYTTHNKSSKAWIRDEGSRYMAEVSRWGNYNKMILGRAWINILTDGASLAASWMAFQMTFSWSKLYHNKLITCFVLLVPLILCAFTKPKVIKH